MTMKNDVVETNDMRASKPSRNSLFVDMGLQTIPPFVHMTCWIEEDFACAVAKPVLRGPQGGG